MGVHGKEHPCIQGDWMGSQEALASLFKEVEDTLKT